MKILILSQGYPNSFENHNGIFVQDQVKELINMGHTVDVVSPVPYCPFPINRLNKKWLELSKLPKITMREGVKISSPRFISLPKNFMLSSTGYFLSLSLIYFFYKNSRKYDIIHAHHAYPCGYAAAFIIKILKLKIPLIITVHGMDTAKHIVYSSDLKNKTIWAMNAAAKVIAVSEKLREEMIFSGVNKEKTVVIANGINYADFKIKSNSSVLKKSNNNIVVSVSNLIKSKGVDINLRAMKLLLDKGINIFYHIIGDGPERSALENLSKELQIGTYVSFYGRLERNEVFKQVNNCDIFSLPSWSEGFGVVYIEAMMLGKPAIGCIGQGIDGTIQHGENGFLVKPSENELAEVWEMLIDDKDLRLSIGSNAKKTILNNYLWNGICKKIVHVYKGEVNI
jgi:teichuronic acid biosynthesis glycosyltransferase TuaC